MSTLLARRLSVGTFIVACLFLASCAPPADVRQTASQPSVTPPAPTSIADGKQTTGPRYEGFLDQADCNTVSGWAWNKDKPNGVEYVEILSDNIPISTPPASGARWSVAQYTGDNGYHGFVYTVHPSLKDGQPHVITARISQTDSMLQNGPKTINCPAK